MRRPVSLSVLLVVLVAGCQSAGAPKSGTLAELENVEADTSDVYLADGLERAAESYRRYLAETSKNARTPEAMRRMADLQIEQAYGVIADRPERSMAAPETATVRTQETTASAPQGPSESEAEFEARATARAEFLSPEAQDDSELAALAGETGPSGPREAIEVYKQILEQYPDYERNDKVLYQMSRAYDEIGEPDLAMQAMDRFVSEYAYSRYYDEVQFRRGEYFFVRRNYRDAEAAYDRVIGLGETSSFFELALYKRGWTLYKQQFYDEALDSFVAMLDYRHSTGFDFETLSEEDEEHRVNDTFRVVSLSFSNMGGAEVIDEYFGEKGHRAYADRIYSNLAEFYFEKLRYDDAATVYRSFVSLNPYHQRAPHFGMRVVEIFSAADFPLLVVDAKKEFATRYALDSEYWLHHDVEESTDVTSFLKTNLGDLAGHYHALYQQDTALEQRPQHFAEAGRWYRELLTSFADDPETPSFNYQFADLLLENEDFALAAVEYERTAYDYAGHEKAADAGYAAVYSYRKELDRVTGARTLDVKQLTVESSLRFADAFQSHEQAPPVLGAAADDLYDMQQFDRAIASARTLIGRYPAADEALRRSAWSVVAHSSLDISEYQDAEVAYSNVLRLTPEDDENRASVVDGLAASIYKQAEQANLLEDYRAAAGHFLRIKELAPTSTIRSAAEYDAAAALMKVEDWTLAADVLEEFRTSHPDNELAGDATIQLAHVYREDGQLERSAAEHERIAVEADDADLSREALLTAGELYDEATAMDDAIRVYRQYVDEYPRPIDLAVETRNRLAEIFKGQLDYRQYYDELGNIVALDANAGADRTDRSRYLAAHSALILAQNKFDNFKRLQLKQPFEESLAAKQGEMDRALAALESLVAYEVAEVTAAATFYIAESYRDFSRALMESERPAGLTAAETTEYEMVLEEQAWPFEEQAIAVHEANLELISAGVYNDWVQNSLDELAVLMPGRYAKHESSEGFVGTLELYVYRMPVVPPMADPAEVASESGEDDANGEALPPVVSRVADAN